MNAAYATPAGGGADRLAPRTPAAASGARLAREWAVPLRWASAVDRAAFILLLLSVAALIFRPVDLWPTLEHAPIYEGLMAACIACSLPRAFGWIMAPTLRSNAIVALACALPPAVVLSHLVHGNTWDARIGGLEAVKVTALFLLLFGLLDSVTRLRITLLVLASAVLLVSMGAILQYHGVLSLPASLAVVQRELPDEGPVILRLCGIGIFSDPNDFALILVVAAVACADWLADARVGWWRAAAGAALAVCVYALWLTHSRGGFLSLAAAGLAFMLARIGWRQALPVAGALLAAVLVFAPGREAALNLGNPEDTFQTRLELWRRSLELFRSAPVLGIGQGTLVDSIGQVAHNSFLHAFAELGLVGGGAFLGVFLLTIRGVWRALPPDRDVLRLRAFVLAVVSGYAVGILSLSRCYTAGTQLVLGIAASYLAMTWRSQGLAPPPLNTRCVSWIATGSAVFLGMTWLFVRLTLLQGET
jgi:O-antigen ligase